MGRQVSTIDTLPEEVRSQLHVWLRDPGITQKEATERLNAICDELDLPRRSKSAVNRYSMQFEEIGAQIRESRELAKVWIGELGAEPQGKIGNLVNEMLRTVAFRLSMYTQGGEITEENAAEIAKISKDLSLMMMRLEKAANLNVEREREIRQQERERLQKETMAVVEASGPMTADQLKEKIREVYGV